MSQPPSQAGVRPITVGVLLQDVDNAYVTPILDALTAVARERGVRVVSFVEWMDSSDLDGGRRLTTSLAGPANVDAILVLPLGYGLSAADVERYCARFAPLPICSVPDVTGDFCSRVSVDNEPGVRAAVRHLIEVHGHSRIAFVRGPEGSDEAEVRYRAYRDELAAHGLPFDEELVAPGYYVVQSGIDAVARFWQRPGPKPEAILCANDGMALGALEALTGRGISVPDDVALVGFDDIELVRYVNPPLTTVRQPLRELGRRTLEILLERLEPGSRPKREVMPSELVIRESCGCSAYSAGERTSSRPHPSQLGVAALGQRTVQAVSAFTALGLSGVPETPWEEQLYSAFLAEVSGGEPLFLPAFERLLASVVGTHGDIGAFHKLITLLWQFVRRNLQPGTPEWWRADSLLHAARVTTSGAAERAPAREQVRYVDAAYKLTRTSNALGTVVDQASASRVLAEHLPEHSILACYVCLYETEQVPVEHCRLVAGFEHGKPLELPEAGIRFESQLILPGAALSREPGCHYIIGPLSRSENSPGYVVFAGGNAPGFVFENLLVHLGSLERRIALLRALVHEATLREAAERERMGKELAIAASIQAGILPRKLAASDLEIAAVMVPASEVGGDYYDVIPVAGGAFLGIGDVAGHGLPTGLVMLMLQSAVSALARTHRDRPPSEILAAVNSVLFENIRDRMRQDEYVTFSLLRYEPGGRVTYAGAHEDLIVYRAGTETVELIPTSGIWLAATRDARDKFPDATLQLEIGDVLLLHTDGITEARNAEGEFFGLDGLAEALRQVGGRPAETIRDTLLEQAKAFAAVQHDDMTLVVARRSA